MVPDRVRRGFAVDADLQPVGFARRAGFEHAFMGFAKAARRAGGPGFARIRIRIRIGVGGRLARRRRGRVRARRVETRVIGAARRQFGAVFARAGVLGDFGDRPGAEQSCDSRAGGQYRLGHHIRRLRLR